VCLISKKPASIECGNKVLAIVVTRFSYSARGLPGFTLLQKAHQRAFQDISPGYRDKFSEHRHHPTCRLVHCHFCQSCRPSGWLWQLNIEILHFKIIKINLNIQVKIKFHNIQL